MNEDFYVNIRRDIGQIQKGGVPFRVEVPVNRAEISEGNQVILDPAEYDTLGSERRVVVEDVMLKVTGGTLWAGTFTKLSLGNENGSVELLSFAKADLSANAKLGKSDATIGDEMYALRGGIKGDDKLALSVDGTCTGGDNLVAIIIGRIMPS